MVPIHFSFTQPSTGDWIVTGMEVAENRNISLDGNLIIKPGGSLILRNVTLTLIVQYNGQHGISVEEGGSMFIYDCNISSTTENRFSFVAKGNSFVMRNSELHGVGWCSSQGDYFLVSHPDELSQSGLMVMTDHAIIEDNIFSGNAVGLVIAGSYLTVARNLFINNSILSLFVFYNHHNTVVNNTLLQNPALFGTCLVQLFYTENNTFLGNTLNGNVTYYYKYRLSQSLGRMDGFNIYESHGNEYVNNNITVPQIPIFIIHSDDSVIIDNKIKYGELAVNILTGVNTRLEGNEITTLQDPNDLQSDWTGGQGIVATLAHNCVMANNTITGHGGILFSHTSNSSILNNNISLTRLLRLSSLVFVGSRNNSVIGNTMSGSEFGIILTGSSDGNLITQNNIFTNHSISFFGSSSNRIFLNNLYDFWEPFGGPYDNGMNFWYSGEDGNYWSHFTSRNAEGNGTGDEPYSRSVILPNGKEPSSLLTPVKITPYPIPQIKPIPRPKVGSRLIESNVISNQVMEIGWGDFPNNVTIVNSTLFLGKEGLVRIPYSVNIINSRLINMGYGFSLGCGGSLTIKNSTIEGAFLDDLNLDNTTIIDSTILNSIGAWGISVARSSSIVIVNSKISGGLGGICTYSGLECDKYLISGNRIYNMVDYGMWVGGNNITITDNTVMGCNMGTGIAIRGPNEVVRGNTISNFKVGLDFQGGAHLIYENNVVNTLYPLFNWGGGLIYHNNFINYSSPLYDALARTQELFYNGEGNYWSNYTGKDMDLDGIGDTPYMISEGGTRDTYPFMTPNGWLTKFWLTIHTNFPSILFQVNGTGFSTDPGGSKMLRLGYTPHYVVTLPRIVEVTQGTRLFLLSFNAGNSNELICDLSSNTTVSATYTTQYYLTIRSQYGNPQGEGWYDAGSMATFSVTSPVGYFVQQAFMAWSGDSKATTTTATIVMDSPKVVSANWRTDYAQAYLMIAVATILIVITIALVWRRVRAKEKE